MSSAFDKLAAGWFTNPTWLPPGATVSPIRFPSSAEIAAAQSRVVDGYDVSRRGYDLGLVLQNPRDWPAIIRHGFERSFEGARNQVVSGYDAAKDYVKDKFNDLTGDSSGPSGSSGGSVSAPSGSSAAAVDYYNAELSKLYGMDKNVAYQEALANTAYQRAVKDMQAAGLNPASLFGAGRASPSDGVGYVGASGGFSGGRSSALGMSKGEYTALSGRNSVIGIVGGAIAGALIPGLTPTSGAQLGSMISDAVTKVMSQW